MAGFCCFLFLKKGKVPKKSYLITSNFGESQRLDIFLSENIRDLSRSHIKRLIEQHDALVSGIARKPSYRLKAGDRVKVSYRFLEPIKVNPQNIPLQFIHRDRHIIVVNKPSGLVVHPGAGKKENTLVNALLFHFPEIKKVGTEERPGIVHRLDKETSGLIVIARNLKAYEELKRQFKAREVSKLYLGLVWGKMSQQEGKITWAVGRHKKHGGRMSIKTKKPRAAETLYTVQKQFEEFTLLEIKPITGRTHQIRVHFSAAGHPLVGDTRYGHRKPVNTCPRLFLHACQLEFSHPETKEKVVVTSPLPDDLQRFLDNLQKENVG